MNDVVNKNMYFKEDKPYYIYIHTCPNYMTYVGVSRNPKQRWNNGEGYKDNERFYQAIKKYGWDNIKHEIVATTYYRKFSQQIERTIITDFKKKKLSYNENNIEKILLDNKSVRKVPLKKVAQYDKEGNLIRIYESASEVWRELRISPSAIQSCCRGRIKMTGGYIWKYV
jgi:predicted GIY-YIG superfamily endonuclease